MDSSGRSAFIEIRDSDWFVHFLSADRAGATPLGRRVAGCCEVCEIGVGEDSADSEINVLADWNALMSGKNRKSNFDHVLEALRAHSFTVAPYAPKADSVLVSKHGAAAILTAGEDGTAAFVERPGALVGGEVARLLDRGYQKFLKTHRFEIPATAGALHAIHLFSEELNQAIGAVDLYNESLGTTSDLYQYDRLKGRQAGGAVSSSPWETQGAGH